MSKKTYKIGDDLIAVVRELVQLSLLTGTNIIDHLRAVQVEVTDGLVVPTEEYVNSYNRYIEELNSQAVKMAEEAEATAQSTVAGDEEPEVFVEKN